METVLKKNRTKPLCLPIFASPHRAGAGFKPEHLQDILHDDRKVGFFEVHAENYMGRGGAPHAALERLRQDYPIFVHGVGLSIGGEAPLNVDHLSRFRAVVERYEPQVVSEHLAWSTHDNTFYNDLLPVPYTNEVLGRVVSHIHCIQDSLGRAMLLENPSTYVTFEASEMSETDFIKAVAKQTGCGLLLDINNVFISATNHNYSAERYLADFPLSSVQEIHLAGHATEIDDEGNPLLIDAHDRIWGIDNGLCFAEDFKLRTVIWEFGGEPIPEHLREALSVVAGEVPAPVTELLDADEVAAVADRAAELLDAGILPIDHTGRRYPWPLV